MNIIKIVILSYIVFFSLYFLVLVIIDLVYKKRLNKAFIHTVAYTDSLGALVSISGTIGSGKTTGAAGLVQCFELAASKNIASDVDEYKKLLYEFDLNVIDKMIISCYVSKESRFKCLDKIFSILPSNKKTSKLGYGTSCYDLKKVLELYISRIYIEMDNCFVISNTPIYSMLTNSYAKNLDPNYLQLKNIYNDIQIKGTCKYPIRDYTAIVLDELNLDTFKKGSNYQAVAKEDAGMDILERLYRNMHRGTSKIFFLMQNPERYIKEEREVFVNNLVMQGCRVISLHRAKKFIVDIIKELVNLSYSLHMFLFHRKHADYYKNKNNVFRRILYNLLIVEYKMFSESFIVYPIRNYHKVKDLYKDNTDNETYYDSFELVFPIMYCFGTTDSYFYEFLQEELERCSSLRINDLEALCMSSSLTKEFKSKLAADILSKKTVVKEKDKKNNDNETISIW